MVLALGLEGQIQIGLSDKGGKTFQAEGTALAKRGTRGFMMDVN